MGRQHISLNHYAVYEVSGDDIMKISNIKHDQQRGAAAVEFAIIAMLLITLLFGIIEFGRMFYMLNTVQEVTRRAARAAVISWVDNSGWQSPEMSQVLFGGVSFPGGGEITANNISIKYLDVSGVEIVSSQRPTSAANNIAACLGGGAYGTCIAYVQVSIVGVSGARCPEPNTDKVCYIPMIGLFPFLSVPIPASTVTMPAESMGYTG